MLVDEPTSNACQQQPQRVPNATYRLQFNRQFTFRQAIDLVPYLAELGISDLYASPLFQAGPQSTHGYDICRFDALNPNLGTEGDFDLLVAALQEHRLGLLLDMVPNHMSAALSNCWWSDVLENGPASPYANWFDVEWQPMQSEFRNQVILPVLEDHYAKVLEEGKLKLLFQTGTLGLAYHELSFPLAPGCYPEVLEPVLARTTGAERARETCQLLCQQAKLSRQDAAAPRIEPELVQKLKGELQLLYKSSSEFRDRLAAALVEINGMPGNSRSFDRLDALLRRQYYRLVYWRTGAEQINYRRFFDVTELVSLRMELPEVFQKTHELVLQLVRNEKITGLRIDHPDGLWDPRQYFERLQGSCGNHFYIVVEKILTTDESLPRDWPVAGTTGYDFLNRLNAIFVQRSNEAAFNKLYASFCGCPECTFAAAVYAGKKHILIHSLVSELNGLTHHLERIVTQTRVGRDLTFGQLQRALIELIAAFPVYRTYVTEQTRRLPERERQYVLEAAATARSRDPALDAFALDLIQKLLLLEPPEELDSAKQQQCGHWVMKFQQLTGPVMAKGLEDTAFYNFNRLISLNEVGGDPGTFGQDVGDFHAHNQMKAQMWPHSLLATATHDTKRGEDLRARLNVLSEMPTQWEQATTRWSKLNAQFKTMLNGEPAPQPNDEYLFYQTLVGIWDTNAGDPAALTVLRERLSAYMLKAMREAKARTSWTLPNPTYEQAMATFIERALAQPPNPFLEDFNRFHQTVAFFGTFNSLSQLLLKLAAPGVPDIYQGTELWDFNVVDPDNRRAVDYRKRRETLAEIKRNTEFGNRNSFLKQLLDQRKTGEIKMYVLWRMLQFRRANPLLFQQGPYLPLEVTGSKKEHVCAFARVCGRTRIIVMAPRLVCGLAGGVPQPPCGEIWGNTSLELRDLGQQVSYLNLFTQETLVASCGQLRVSEAFRMFPVALLVARQSSQTEAF